MRITLRRHNPLPPRVPPRRQILPGIVIAVPTLRLEPAQDVGPPPRGPGDRDRVAEAVYGYSF